MVVNYVFILVILNSNQGQLTQSLFLILMYKEYLMIIHKKRKVHAFLKLLNMSA